MKHTLTALLAVLLGLTVRAGIAQDATVAAPVTLLRTQQMTMHARANDREYRIFIAEPTGKQLPEGYPVIYLLDANAVFGTMVEATRVQSALGPVVVAGVGYPTEGTFDIDRRYYDYTPVTPPERMQRSGTEALPKAGGTGGQERFFSFIQDELKPQIEQKFKIDRTRQTLFGHSLGGLFALHVLFTHTASFQNYVAASPSIWWNGQSILEEERAFEAQSPTQGQPVSALLTVGELEQKPPVGTPPERAAFLKQARMADNARDVVKRLGDVKTMRVEFLEFAGENHGSVMPAAISRAVRWAMQAVPAKKP